MMGEVFEVFTNLVLVKESLECAAMKAAWKGRHVRLWILRSWPPDPAPSRYVMALSTSQTTLAIG